MKERLTQWVNDGASLILDNPKNELEARQQLMEKYKQACIKLADYEDLEEQGLIVRLPCKLGDKVYHISGKNIKEEMIIKVDYDIHNGEIDLCNSFIYTKDIYDKEDNFYRLGKFGKSVFLSRAEAEKKLKGEED